jgi:hypothetical protein
MAKKIGAEKPFVWRRKAMTTDIEERLNNTRFDHNSLKDSEF